MARLSPMGHQKPKFGQLLGRCISHGIAWILSNVRLHPEASLEASIADANYVSHSNETLKQHDILNLGINMT